MAKSFAVVVALIIVILFGLGFFAGHLYTVRKCSPNPLDFDAAYKFTSLISEELRKLEESNSWGYDIVTTIGGPVLEISVRKVTVDGAIITVKETFKKEIKIRKEIREKVLFLSNKNFYDEDFERIRPLAKEIAGKIIKAQE